MKFESKPIEEHPEVPLADEGRWEDLVAHFRKRQGHAATAGPGQNTCYVVSVVLREDPSDGEAQLAEIAALVRAQGDEVAGSEIHRPRRWDPRTLLGSGVCEEIAARASARGANMVVIDAELTPSQARNIEDASGLAVSDREAVILNVFLKHARTRRARIQVELAQLEYLRPRIRGLGLDMDQQAAGVGPARGPGETASELLARRLDGRLAVLKRALAKVGRAGATQRKERSACKRIALVGYTNAGKTSLMNALTGTSLSARDVPFETLDTTSRCLTRHGGDVVLSDTVGFIRRLPERLMASFESTLAEVVEADLLVWVVDVSDPDRELHLETTEEVLRKLDAAEIPRFYVFNKIDRLETPPAPELLAEWGRGHDLVALSSFDTGAVAALEQALIQKVRGPRVLSRLFVPYGLSEVMTAVYAKCRVISAEPTPEGLDFTLECEPEIAERLRRTIMKEQR